MGAIPTLFRGAASYWNARRITYLVRNVLLIYGVVSLALTTAADLEGVFKVAHIGQFFFDNWTSFVETVWKSISDWLYMPYIPELAKPFFVLLSVFAVGLSGLITFATQRDASIEEWMGSLQDAA